MDGGIGLGAERIAGLRRGCGAVPRDRDVSTAGRGGVPWPSFRRLLALEGAKSHDLGRVLRLAWRLWRARSTRPVMNAAVAGVPALRQVLAAHPELLRPLLAQFLDPRLGVAARHRAFAHDLTFTAPRLDAAYAGFFPHGRTAELWRDERNGWSVAIELNLQSPQEGLWRLALLAPDGMRVFSLCFSVLNGPELFLGAVQGGTVGARCGALEHIQAATRDLEGLRPAFLLVEALRAVGACWQIERFTGIGAAHQPKTWAKRRARAEIRFDYDRFFQDLGGARRPDGNWDVPPVAAERRREDVPSRKRAMYRRRFGLLRALRASVGERLVRDGVVASSIRYCDTV